MIPAMIMLPVFWIATFLTIHGIAIIFLGALWVADFIYIGHLHEKIEEKFFHEEEPASQNNFYMQHQSQSHTS